MVSYRGLLAVVEAEQLGTKKTAAAPRDHRRTELFNALEVYFPHFQFFLTFPGPQPEDRAQVSAEDLRLPNSLSTAVSTQDTQIVLKLSDDLNLNELYCASLFDSARQEWNLQGRGPLEILRLSAGLWFTERRALISSLQLLIQAVMDDEWDPDLAVEIHLYIERLLNAGLRTRLITLIKELNQEGPSGLGGHGVEPYVVDSSGAIVLRCNVVHKERLSLSHCLLLMCSAFPINAKEAKDLYNLLRDCSTEESLLNEDVKFQITYTIMCLLSNSLVSNALGQPQDWLALDAGFRRDFQLLVMDAADLGPIAVGFTGVIRFVWAVYLMLTEGGTGGTSTGSSFLDDECSSLCLDQACEQDVFEFLNARVLQSATFQKDDYIVLSKYNAYLCKLLAGFFSSGREKIMELKRATLDTVGKHMIHGKETTAVGDGRAQPQAMDIQAKPFISLLNLVGEIYKRQPNLILDNEDLWNFVQFAGEDQTSHWTLVAFLNMLTALAVCEEGARKVYHSLQKKSIRTLGWQTLFNSLVVYDQRFRQFLQIPGAVLPLFQERDGRALEAYLSVLRRVIMTGNEIERTEWFTDIEPLFKLLPYENVPPYLKGALRSAITNFVYVSPEMKNKVWCLLEQYDLPVPPTPLPTNGSLIQASSQVYDISFELNEVEARLEEYPSTLSYLKLHNIFIANATDTSDKGVRHMGLFRFVRDQLFARQSQRAFANLVEKWELAAAALHHFELMLSVYKLTDEEIKNSTVDILPPEKSLLGMVAPYSATGVTAQIPAMEVMKDLMNGKVIYHNLMSILMLGVNSVMEQRTGQLHGSVLEEAICLSFKILILAFSKDILYAEAWSPVYQPIHIVLSRDSQLIVTLLEYVRYDKLPLIQRYSIQIMNLLSARMPKLVSVILEAGAAPNFIKDYATCLQAHTVETEVQENPVDDISALILRLLLTNLGQPSPNVTHLLLSFDLNQPTEKTRLQPDRHFRQTSDSLEVILDFLDTPARPGLNAGLQGLCYQLIHELCVDPVTCGLMLEILGGEKYDTNLKRTLGIGSCMFMDKGKSPAFPEVVLSPEVYDLELQTCHPGEAEAAELPDASNSREALGFLNPTPLATRCTTKQNDRTTGSSMGALRSSWIQRLFLGILGEGTMPSRWKEKEKQPGPPREEGVHLLLKDKRSSEDPGHQVQASFNGQSGQDSCDIDKRPGLMQEISAEDCVLEHNYGSQILSTSIVRKGPACAIEGRGIQPGGERELTAKISYAVGGVALITHAEDNVERFIDLKLEGDHEGNTALLSGKQSLNAAKGVEHSLTGIPPLVPPRFKDQPKSGEKLQGNMHPSTLWSQNTGEQRLEMQGTSELPSGQSWLPAPQSIPDMMVWEPNEGSAMKKVSRHAGQGENTAAAGTSEPSMSGEVNRSPPCDLQPLVKDNVHSRDQKHEGNKTFQISSALSHRSPLQHPIEDSTEESSLIKNHRPGIRETIRTQQQPVLGAFGPGSSSVATAQSPLELPGARMSPAVDYPGSGDGQRSGGQEEELNKHVDLQKNSGFQVHCSDKKEIDNGLLSSSLLLPLSLFAPFKHKKERQRLACRGKTKVDPAVSGESLLTPLFPSHGYMKHNDEDDDDGIIPKDKFDATIFAPYKPSPDPVSSSSRGDTLKLPHAAMSMSRSSFMAPTRAPLRTTKEQHEPSASSSKPESVAVDLMDVDDRNAIDTRREHLGTKPYFGSEVNAHLVSDQQGSTSNHINANKHISVHSSSLVPEWVIETAVSLQTPVPGFYGGGSQQAENPCKTVNTSAIELTSRRLSLHDEADDKELEQEPSRVGGLLKVEHILQEQHLKVQERPPRNLRPYAPSCEASSASSTPMAGGLVPHGHQLFSLPPSSSGKDHVSVIARTSMLPGKQHIMRSSLQGRLKNSAPSSSGVKGGNEILAEDPDCKEREREITASAQEPERGDGGHDHMERRSGALPGEGTAELLGQGLIQGGEIRHDTCQMWTDAPGDRPGRSSRKRSHDAGTRIYGTHAQNPENSCVDPNYLPKRDMSQAPPQTRAWLQRWMSSPRPKALPASTQNAFAGRFSSEQAPTHAKNRKLVQESTVQGKFFNHTGPAFRAQRRPQDLQGGDSSLGASYRDDFQDSSLFCPGFYSLPSAAALALVGAASRKIVPLPPQRIGTRVAVWPAIAGSQVEGNESGFQGGILLQPEVRVTVEEGEPTNCTRGGGM